MANGIDSIYDPSDVSRMLAEMRQQRLEMEDARRRKTQGTTKVATTAWEMWNREQTTKAKELIGSGDYTWDPKSNWVNKLYTPSGGQVVPSEQAIAKGKDFVDIRGPKTIKESISKAVKPATEVASKAGEKATKATESSLGKVGAGIGAGLSAYDLATNWKKKSDVDKVLGIASTALYAGSILNPALGIYALGTSLLDAFWD